MQLNLKHNQCIAITKANKPVCRHCVKKEMENWLKRRNPSLLPRLKKVSQDFFNTSDFTDKTICISCNKRINTCDYCFRKHIKSWIEKNQPKLLLEFRLFFGFKIIL